MRPVGGLSWRKILGVRLRVENALFSILEAIGAKLVFGTASWFAVLKRVHECSRVHLLQLVSGALLTPVFGLHNFAFKVTNRFQHRRMLCLSAQIALLRSDNFLLNVDDFFLGPNLDSGFDKLLGRLRSRREMLYTRLKN